jgi:hypothetical protein
MKIQTALVLIFCGFAANSFMKWLYLRVPISRILSKLRHEVDGDKDQLVPAAQHSTPIAIDEAQIEEKDKGFGESVSK